MKKRLESIPLKNITIDDPSWNPYIRLVKDTILPYQWKILNDQVEEAESSHCIQNFKIAAGEEDGEFQGVVFQDSDVAKWLEAVAYSLEVWPDEALMQLADETIDLIGRAQQADGYLNTYFTIKAPELKWKNLQEGHELYTAGHMIEAAVAYCHATGKRKFLEIVILLADLLCQVFGPEEGQCHGYPGHQEIELALVKLYYATEVKRYLELARYFIEQRGQGENYFLQESKARGEVSIFPEFAEYDPSYSQSHLPVREQKTAEGHAVRAVYMYCGMADLAGEYQDESLLEACRTLWQNMIKKRMYITGSIGSSGILERFTVDYDLPNDRNYSETCASIGLALFGKRMAGITGDASYLDVVEVALYNTIQSGIAIDGRKFFYVNPLEVWPDNCKSRTSMEHVKPVRQTWFGVACCPPNIARTLASLGQYIYFQDDCTVYLNLYISNQVHTNICGEELSLQVSTSLPVKGVTRVVLESKGQQKKTVAFRVPAYAERFHITDDQGHEIPVRIEQGYARVTGNFAHTVFTVAFDQPVRYVRANPMVRADAGKVAVMKGPVVYCLEEMDNGSNLSSLYLDTGEVPEEIFEPELLSGTLTIRLKGKRIIPDAWTEDQLYGGHVLKLEPAELKAVPYGKWGNRTPGEMTVWMKELL